MSLILKKKVLIYNLTEHQIYTKFNNHWNFSATTLLCIFFNSNIKFQYLQDSLQFCEKPSKP